MNSFIRHKIMLYLYKSNYTYITIIIINIHSIVHIVVLFYLFIVAITIMFIKSVVKIVKYTKTIKKQQQKQKTIINHYLLNINHTYQYISTKLLNFFISGTDNFEILNLREIY